MDKKIVKETYVLYSLAAPFILLLLTRHYLTFGLFCADTCTDGSAEVNQMVIRFFIAMNVVQYILFCINSNYNLKNSLICSLNIFATGYIASMGSFYFIIGMLFTPLLVLHLIVWCLLLRSYINKQYLVEEQNILKETFSFVFPTLALCCMVIILLYLCNVYS